MLHNYFLTLNQSSSKICIKTEPVLYTFDWQVCVHRFEMQLMSLFQHVVCCQRLRLPCYSWISVREVNFLFDFVNVLTILGPVSTSVTFVNSSLQRGKLKLQETVLNTLVFSKAPMFGRSKVCSKVVSCMYQTNCII